MGNNDLTPALTQYASAKTKAQESLKQRINDILTDDQKARYKALFTRPKVRKNILKGKLGNNV